MEPRYVFGVTIRLEVSGMVWVEPDTFETKLYRPADPPGEEGWLFFRDTLWRGELADPDHFRDLVDAALTAQVSAVDFRSFQTDEDSFRRLKAEMRAHLDDLRSDSVAEAINKYFGSSIEVT